MVFGTKDGADGGVNLAKEIRAATVVVPHFELDGLTGLEDVVDLEGADEVRVEVILNGFGLANFIPAVVGLHGDDHEGIAFAEDVGILELAGREEDFNLLSHNY